MTKAVAVVLALVMGGAAWVTYYGIASESTSVVRSVRAGSVGNAAGFGVK